MQIIKILTFWSVFLLCTISPLPAQKRPSDYVNVFTGTSNSRWMIFPGPAMPFGMVKLSPDNQGNVWNGGYEYTIASIAGFSHIHSWSMGGLSIMPVTGGLKTFPGPSDGPFRHMWTAGYRSRFLKEEEKAEVGYYRVRLYDYDITAELTATTRCGYLRFTFPETGNRRLIFNLNAEYEENAPSMKGAFYRKVNDYEIEGYIKQYSSFADEYTVHFVARFNQPIFDLTSWESLPFEGNALYGTNWQRMNLLYKDNSREIKGDCGFSIGFNTSSNEPVEVQTAISLVSIEQARLNLHTEMDSFGWDFNKVVEACKSEWDRLLGRIMVQDPNPENISLLYTNLYRAYAGRTMWDDVNGKYTDMCENTRQLPPGRNHIYGSDALWGAHWNLFPLWTLLTPGIANDWVNSLLEMYDHGGWLPQGPEGIEYCEVMVGAHQIKLIVSAYQKGIRNFDVQKAYEAIRKNQTEPGIKHPCGGWAGNKNLDSFLKYGYVANEDGPVSNTLELAFDNYALAQFAKALGKKEDYKYFTALSMNYKNVFDPETRFMRQKHSDGRWVQDWDSLSNHGTWYGAGYVEGTAWHYSFFVPHDYPGLIKMVGKDEFTKRLEQGFEKGYIDIGNQPNMQAPFIFNHAGSPWLTQKYIRQIINHEFDLSPYRGWPGEEDQGQLGAWFVLASLGLFQMDGGCSEDSWYDLSTPLFERVVIQLDQDYYPGRDLTITCKNNLPGNIFIRSVTFNGKPLRELRIRHSELVKGGVLEFELSPDPSTGKSKK